MITNVLAIIIIIGTVTVALAIFFRRANMEDIEQEDPISMFSIEYLTSQVEETFNIIRKTKIEDLNLNRIESEKVALNRKKLVKSLDTCAFGDIGSKEYLKEYIRDVLQQRCGITEENVDNVIPFLTASMLSINDKFDICLYVYKVKKGFGLNSFPQMITDFNLVKERYNEHNEIYYEISKEDIIKIFDTMQPLKGLDFNDKLVLISQRIYQRYKGLGVIDEIRDTNIDGISSGTSGIPSTMYSYAEDLDYNPDDPSSPLASYNSIWIMFQGKNVRLSFLGYGSNKELIRVCKIVYRYGNPCQLSENKGYVINNTMTGDRVDVLRPPLTESWGFYMRKFGTVADKNIYDLIVGTNAMLAVEMIHWAFRGCLNTILTGTQGAGKTVMLSSLVQFMPPAKTLRVFEKSFEMALRKRYKTRNIMTFQETDYIPLQEAIDASKKTDGNISIFAEVAEDIHASMAIQTGRVASDMLLGTHHAITAEDLVKAFRDSIIRCGGGDNIEIVTVDVASTIHLNIHLTKDVTGNRHIERITEIIPKEASPYSANVNEATIDYYNRVTDRELFTCVDLIVWDTELGGFRILNNFSERAKNRIEKNLNNITYKEWKKFYQKIDEIVAKQRGKVNV